MSGPKRIALLQSNYIPWKGYFDLISYVDEFYYYDEVQFTKNDWRNRNQILTQHGKQWLTIPVRHEYLGQKIKDIKVLRMDWSKKHWNTLQTNYGKSPNFKLLSEVFREFYLNNQREYLSDINQELNALIIEILGIKTLVGSSDSYNLLGDKNERIIDLCKKVKADIYVSGPAAKDYLNEELFLYNGISVEWYSYDYDYNYNQLTDYSFDPFVSVIDFLFKADQVKMN